MLAIAVCIVSQFIFQVKGKDGCRDLEYLNCVQNKALTGHVISNFSLLTPALYRCQHQCFLEGKCVSYNLGPVRGYVRPCELNAADHSTRPNFLVTKKGYEYCPIRNPCLSSPCPADRLCTPNLSWNTFNCNDGGWTQWSSWTAGCILPSCKRIRSRNCTSPAPKIKGTSCSGLAQETKECHVPKTKITECENPLGMEDGSIPADKITASTWHAKPDPLHGPYHARLNKQASAGSIGGWAAGAVRINEYIQIDLGSVKVITKVAIQGRAPGNKWNHWVTKYSLSYSNDTIKWSDYKGDHVKVFPGNTDRTTIITNKLDVPIWTRHIRLIVKGYHWHPVLRMELYGCCLLVM